jgi:hypothetical protein
VHRGARTGVIRGEQVSALTRLGRLGRLYGATGVPLTPCATCGPRHRRSSRALAARRLLLPELSVPPREVAVRSGCYQLADELRSVGPRSAGCAGTITGLCIPPESGRC